MPDDCCDNSAWLRQKLTNVAALLRQLEATARAVELGKEGDELAACHAAAAEVYERKLKELVSP